MGIWQFTTGAIADLAALALIGQPVAPGAAGDNAQLPLRPAAVGPGLAAATPAAGATRSLGELVGRPSGKPDDRGAILAQGRQPARPLIIDFALSASWPGMAIRRAVDGLFYCDAWVNGVSVRFLVDTGATTVVLTPADAARAGVLPGPAAFQYTAQTAGGRTAMARIRLAQLTAGAAERRDVDAAIAGTGLGVSLLGQSYLSQLASVQISGDTMVLE